MRISDWSSDVCSSDLRIGRQSFAGAGLSRRSAGGPCHHRDAEDDSDGKGHADQRAWGDRRASRSEEHTSELQSLMRISYAVFCLKKKKKKRTIYIVIRVYTNYQTIRIKNQTLNN